MQYNNIVTRQALYRYQKTVLEALEEAENAICSYKKGEERQIHLNQAYQINKRSADSAEQLYEKGLNDYMSVAMSEKALLNSETVRLQGQIDSLLNYISLYKALGGSW